MWISNRWRWSSRKCVLLKCVPRNKNDSINRSVVPMSFENKCFINMSANWRCAFLFCTVWGHTQISCEITGELTSPCILTLCWIVRGPVFSLAQLMLCYFFPDIALHHSSDSDGFAELWVRDGGGWTGQLFTVSSAGQHEQPDWSRWESRRVSLLSRGWQLYLWNTPFI